jgi:hypothetical protein
VLYQGGRTDFSNRATTDPAVSAQVTVNLGNRALNSTSLLANAFFEPVLDWYDRTSFVQVYGTVTGPYPIFDGTTPMPAGNTLKASASAAGQTVPMTLQILNGDSRPLEWFTELDAQPNLTRLSIVNAEIRGDPGGAFSLGSLPTPINIGATKQLVVNFTPPVLGAFHATLRVTTDANANFGQAGRVYEIPLFGSTGDFHSWAAALPEGSRGVNDDPNQNGIANLLEYGLNGGGLGALPVTPTSGQARFDLPASLRPDVLWTLDGSTNLAGWQRVATRNPATGAWSSSAPLGSVVEQLISGVRRTSLALPVSLPSYFIRLSGAETSNGYRNDFTTSASATPRGSATLQAGTLQLTDGSPGQTNAAVLDGISAWPGQTGFSAAFDLNMAYGPGALADGMSFSVGDLGTAAWGENGPSTAHHLTVAFDTFDNGVGQTQATGIRLLVNGTMIAYSPTNPFTNGAMVPVEVLYTPASGVTVKFNGATIFSGEAVPSFTLLAGDQFGFGARTGSYTQISQVDNVLIQPR